MEKPNKFGWYRPGMKSENYGISYSHDHDYRTYSNTNYSGIGPNNYQRSDHSIYEEVCELLKWDPEVDARGIEVSVRGGVVFLEGNVDSRHAKRRAEIILDHVRGILDVQNHIYIKPQLDINSKKIIARGDDGLFSQEISPQ
jgi:hypothetical protein